MEGRYDQCKLSSFLDATILTTNGFQLYKDPKKQALLRKLAAERGLVVLTDSDGAGLQIRRFLSGMIPKDQIIHVYIPDVFGKERRKAAYSKEGKLGVEGMELSVLRQALERAGATVEDGPQPAPQGEPLTKADLYRWGLSGGEDSAARRKELQRRLGLPERLSAGGLLQALNTLYGRQAFEEFLEKGELHNGSGEGSPAQGPV